MVCNWSVFYQKVSIFGLAQIKFKLSIFQTDLCVNSLMYLFKNVRYIGLVSTMMMSSKQF